MLSIKEGTFVVILLMRILRLCHSFSSLDMQSTDELKESKRALMKSLGVKYARRSILKQNDFLTKRYSAPKFMMGLFKEVTNETKHLLNDTDEHYKMEKEYLHDTQVDTVISFFKYDHDKSWNRIHKEFKIKFKMHFDSKTEIVRGGELKIFKRYPRDRRIKDANCSMSVYLIAPDGSANQFIDKLDVRAGTTDWHTFNITTALKIWALFPQRNHGLKIVVRNAHGELSPHAFGVIGTRGNLEKRPYLLGFMTVTRDFTKLVFKNLPLSRERRATKKTKQTARNAKHECKLKEFRVDFKEVGYTSIIAPLSYDMYFCKGSCAYYPIDPSLKPTFHTNLQTLFHIVNSSAAPAPCCVPGILKPISILYYQDDGNIALTEYPDLVATSCICR